MYFLSHLACICAILVLNMEAFNTSDASVKVQWPRVYLFGASFTQASFSDEGGWATLLADKFQRKCDILARGFSGYTTRMGKYVLPRVFDRDDAPSTVAFIIWLGTNDGVPDQDTGLLRVPLEEYVENLEAMLNYLQGCGVKRGSIILLTPPAFDEIKHRKSNPTTKRSSRLAAQYAEACVSLGTRRNVTVVDLRSEMLKHENWQDMLTDGLHFAKRGSQLVASLLLPKLEKLTAGIPVFFPESASLHGKDPKSLLLSWQPEI